MTARQSRTTIARPTVASNAGPAATAAVLTVTLALAALAWVATVGQMHGMDMGVATELGSFVSFAGVWLSMMAAMMLPGAAPAVRRLIRASSELRALPLFLVSYVGVWALVGGVVYAVYRPHSSSVAGAVTIVAGLYELTPLKRRCRRRCRDSSRSGAGFGLYCVGSSIGLMLMLVAIGIMSLTWMTVIAALVLVQKLLPAKGSVDVPLALAIVGLGIWIVLAPMSVPGLTLPM